MRQHVLILNDAGAVTAEFRVSLPPRLTPADEEHVIRTGETFTLICEASKPIEWKLPKLSVYNASLRF